MMDYGELKDLAEAFVGRGCTEYPTELDTALHYTAKTGIVRMPWSLFGPVLHYRLEQEINSVFFGRSLNKEDKEMCEQLLKQLDNFDNPPFTIQRLCELIAQPKKHYKKLYCYMRAIEKNLLVVGTQEPDLDWMQDERLQTMDKSSHKNQDNGTHTVPHSPPPVNPQQPPTDKDSPPMAPTSTWSNLQEEKHTGNIDTQSSREEGGRTHSPPLSNRKRSRDSLGQDEANGSSITVRQEADSTVNIEPPPFNPLPPLFQMIDESPNKRSREFVEGEGEQTRSEETMETCVEKREETILSSSTEEVTVMDTVGAGEGRVTEEREGSRGRVGGESVGGDGGRVEGSQHKTNNFLSDKTNSDEAILTTDQDGRLVSSDCHEAMITN